ncbi:MAG: YhjD/YihY/BrkB family envelope integrity protein [Acidimicrobiia bacterium]|nr:YhjD/YihY/BrkB family envelope integrity protein [Acidimicrobiia bacterium]
MTRPTVDAPVREALEKPGIRGILAAAWKKFSADKAARMGAALAYYTVFAIAPLILVAVGVAGIVLSEEAIQGEIVDRLADTIGRESAVFVEGLVARAGGGAGVGGTVVGSLLSLVAASAVAVQLKGALDTVWDVPAERRMGIVPALLSRAKGVAVVLGVGGILLAIMAASALLAGLESLTSSQVVETLLDVLEPIVGLVLGAFAFTVMFRYLPQRRVPWAEAWIGGGTAAFLFVVASIGLSRYLGTGTVGAGFGAAAALVVLLVFVYYASQAVLFGAEAARVWGIRRRGEHTTTDAQDVEPAGMDADDEVPEAPWWAVVAFALGWLVGRRR